MSDEDQTPWRERYWWEDDLVRMERERTERALSEGKDEDHYFETDPDRKITLEDCFRFIRTCQSMPEVWDSLANIHIPSPEEEADGYEWSEEDDKRNDVSNYFLRWYAMKHHPGVHYSTFTAPAAVIERYGNGLIDNLFGEEAIDFLQLSNLYTMYEKHDIDGLRPFNISSSSPKVLKRTMRNWSWT